MITIDLPNNETILYDSDHNGLTTRLNINGSIANLSVKEKCCLCNCKCEYTEKVFSEVGVINNPAFNDKTSFLFKKLIASDTIDIYLCNSSNRIAITDNTYGLFYPAGYFSLMPLYVGFVADWNLIYNLLCPGSYWFEIDTTILGVTETIYSICYDLKKYDYANAQFTVRIETWNTGVILNSDFDYAKLIPELPLGWYQSYRIGGKLLAKIPKLTIDNYYDQDYQLLQIQDKISDTYELETHLLPASISNQIIYDNLLANTILISDYNLWNEEIIRQINLYPIEINKKYYAYNNNCNFNIKFTTKFDNIIKNNF